MKTTYINLGNMIRHYRELMSESITQTASSIGIDRSHLSKIEHGHERPSEVVLLKLMRHFNLNSEKSKGMWQAAGYQSVLHIQGESEGNSKEKNMEEEKMLQPTEGQPVRININTLNTPVYYTDAVVLSSDPNDFGVVFNFAQVAGTDMNVVSRVGMSLEHAHNLLETLNNHLAKSSGRKTTKR